MRVSVVRLLALAVLLCTALPKALFAGQPDACCVPIAVDVVLKLASGRKPALEITVKNTGKSPITFDIGDGPWVGPNQIQLVAIRLPLGDALINRSRAVLDPAFRKITLAPGESEVHEILLRDIYPELAAELEIGQHEVVLFWTYQLFAEDWHSERLGGWLLIPKV